MKYVIRSITFGWLALLLPFAGPVLGQPAQSGSVEVNGARIAYRTAGHGEPILLIHGYPLSGELFAYNRDVLSRSYRVITPDLRGFGHSTAPDSDKGSIPTYAKDMLALMDRLNVRQAIIGGMSMGGPVVLEMYRQAPQRFKGIILIDTTAGPASFVEKGEWPGFGNEATHKGVPAMVPLLLPSMLIGQTRVARPELSSYLGGIVKQCSLNGAVGGGSALANRPNSMPTLAQIKVPTLILAGLSDPIYPVETQKKMHRAIAGSKLVVLPRAAHAAIVEQAEVANRAIRAWARDIR